MSILLWERRHYKFVLNVILLTAFLMYENHCNGNLNLAMIFYKIYIRAHWFLSEWFLYILFLYKNFNSFHTFFKHYRFVVKVILFTAVIM